MTDEKIASLAARSFGPREVQELATALGVPSVDAQSAVSRAAWKFADAIRAALSDAKKG